jgi:hypothetical protein
MKDVLLDGINRQITVLRRQIGVLTQPGCSIQVLDDGMLRDGTPNLVKELRNLIDSLEVMAAMLRGPPPGLF